MKINVGQATLASLDILIEMSAKQRAFQSVILKVLCDNDDQYASMMELLNEQSKEESNLIRAKVLQYANIDIDDFLNGEVDI